MRLICHDSVREQLLEMIKPYQHIDLTIVEMGCQYEGACYCFSMNNVDKLIDYLKSLDEQYIVGFIESKQYKIKSEDILYIEGFSRDIYIYTINNQYRTFTRLYEIEEKLSHKGLLRINKSMIVNLKYVEYIVPDVQSRYIAILKNKEKLVVKRKYVPQFKSKW